MLKQVELDGDSLSFAAVAAVSRENKKVSLSAKSLSAMKQSRAMLEHWVDNNEIVYGITTGFGPFVSTLIPTRFQSELQYNLIRSHSANVGPLFSTEETRAAMLLRLNAFAKGYSAVRVETAKTLCALLNKGLHPMVPQWGSVGASGDLTPSAHIALAMIGEGYVEYRGKRVKARQALKAAGIKPIRLMAKEGLALINGTTMMTGVASLQVSDAWNLVKHAELIASLSLQVLYGSLEPFLGRAQLAKPHPGQIRSARNMRTLLKGSGLVWNRSKLSKIQKDLQKRIEDGDEVVDSGVHVQNVYSLRAIPQVLGAVRDAFTYISERVKTEMNSANDNPLFFADLGIAYQGAHFHGQSVALPMDVLSISLTEIGVLSERRLNKMLDPARNEGLSAFLAGPKAGLRCGFEGLQYIPTSLIAECRSLCNPVSIQSIPSNGENQDVVSMGLIAARKARDIKEKIEYVLAAELLAACQAFEERDQSRASAPAKTVYELFRSHISPYGTDRVLSEDMETVKDLIHQGVLLEALRQKHDIHL